MSEINIVKINAAIPGLGITGQFIIDTLKVPAARQEKRALFWNASDWPLICQKLTEHVAKGALADIAKMSGERTPPKSKVEPAGDSFFEDPAPTPAADPFFEDGTPDRPAADEEFFG